jgi:hypothetical protein
MGNWTKQNLTEKKRFKRPKTHEKAFSIRLDIFKWAGSDNEDGLYCYNVWNTVNL